MKQPTGNVTFLFTDIEGSTKLAQEFPVSLNIALEKHNSILKHTLESNNGFVFKTIGDAFCCAFEKAEDAVKAAVDIQIKLASEKWDDAEIKIRIGIHTGDAVWNGKKYMGYITLARTARIMSSAFGEQIIVSDNAYRLCRDKFDSAEKKNISFRDLGERRLKDVILPIRLFQIESQDLRSDFPPLKTLDARPNNLPVQLTSFIGREDVMLQMRELFKQTRLMTVIGSGGIGKTRLSMQFGADHIDEFPNGVFFIELATVNDPALIVQTILTSLSIKEESKRLPVETLINYLKEKEMLLILDNCEHLINEIANLSETLLSVCNKLKIIATSREVLNCQGEQMLKVPPLSFPESTGEMNPENLLKFDSLLLFKERALAVNPGFHLDEENIPALAEICRHLDGIALAIELAAATSKYLSVEKIQERLDDRFKLLTKGKRTAIPRHQTLKAMIDWSYELLSEKEKLLWKRLSVFKGGWDLVSAEEICSDEKILKAEVFYLLSQLSEKSIIIFDVKNDRYTILETIKKYGEERLREENGIAELFTRHLIYFMNYSKNAESKLAGKELPLWLEKLEADHLNFQSAVEWSISSGEREKGVKLTESLKRFCDIRGHYSTDRLLLNNILEDKEGISKPLLCKALLHAAQLDRFQGKYAEAKEHYEECLKLCSEIDDKLGIASSLTGLGNISLEFEDYEQAQKYYEQSLQIRRVFGDKHSVAKSLNNLGNIELRRKNYDLVHKLYEESLELKREIGEKQGIANSLHNIGVLAFDLGDFEKGKKFVEESLELRKELGDKVGMTESLFNLGKAFFEIKNYELSQKYFEESLALSRELEDVYDITKSLNFLGNLELIQKNYAQAQMFFEETILTARKTGLKHVLAEALFGSGNVFYNLKNYDECRKIFKQYLMLEFESEKKVNMLSVFILLAEIINMENDTISAVKVLGAVRSLEKTGEMLYEENELTEYERINTQLKEKLSSEDFLKYFNEGQKLSPDEAADFAASFC